MFKLPYRHNVYEPVSDMDEKIYEAVDRLTEKSGAYRAMRAPQSVNASSARKWSSPSFMQRITYAMMSLVGLCSPIVTVVTWHHFQTPIVRYGMALIQATLTIALFWSLQRQRTRDAYGNLMDLQSEASGARLVDDETFAWVIRMRETAQAQSSDFRLSYQWDRFLSHPSSHSSIQDTERLASKTHSLNAIMKKVVDELEQHRRAVCTSLALYEAATNETERQVMGEAFLQASREYAKQKQQMTSDVRFIQRSVRHIWQGDVLATIDTIINHFAERVPEQTTVRVNCDEPTDETEATNRPDPETKRRRQ